MTLNQSALTDLLAARCVPAATWISCARQCSWCCKR